MAELCACDSGTPGFGVIDCFGKPDRPVGIGFMPLKSGGALNVITAPLNQAAWEALLYTKDATQRLSLLNDVKAYTSERDDAVTETIDTIDYYISEGKKMVSFEMIGVPAKLKAYVDSLRCGKNGFVAPTASGQLLGMRRAIGADELFPIPIIAQTVTSKIIDKTKETLAKMMIMFQIAESVNDADIVYIPADEITADLVDTGAMIQTIATTTGTSTTTSTTQEVQLDFSMSGVISANGMEAYEGISTATYFEIYNQNTLATVLVSGVSESAVTPGLYTLTFAAQTTPDVLEFSASNTAPFDFVAFTKASL